MSHGIRELDEGDSDLKQRISIFSHYVRSPIITIRMYKKKADFNFVQITLEVNVKRCMYRLA